MKDMPMHTLPSAAGQDILMLPPAGTAIACARFDPPAAAPEADRVRPTIVLLHEALGSVSQWGSFPARLAEACALPVFAYSRPGYGRSGPVAGDYAPDYLSHEATTILPAVLAAAGITRPILFGHSDGATIALLHAAAFPQGPRAIVVEAPHSFVEEKAVQAIARIGAAAQETALIDRLGRHHDDPEGIFRRWSRIWLSPAFRNWDIRATIAAIRCPVLAIQGEADEYGTLQQIDVLEAALPGRVERLVLADCGHSPHRDQRTRVLTATARFIRAHAG